MNAVELFVIAVGLSMDAFAVSLGAGTTEHAHGFRPKFRLAFHFGLFQGLMTLAGWFLGVSTSRFLTQWDHWVAFGLLGFVGTRMIMEGMNPKEEEASVNPSKGLTLVTLSVATSLDAMAVGLTMGLLGTNITVPSIVIGIVTAINSYIGVKIGRVLGKRFGKRMEIVGGVLLNLIGLNILIQGLRA